MIGNLRSLIREASKEIEELKIMIKKSEEELDKCYQLRPILDNICNNALNGYNSLQRAGNSLNRGIKIGGVGQGDKILERSVNIKKLSNNASIAAVNVKNRINELENNIDLWNTRISQLQANISGYEAEIRRIETQNRIKKSNIIS